MSLLLLLASSSVAVSNESIAPVVGTHELHRGWSAFETTGTVVTTGYTEATDATLTSISVIENVTPERIQIGALEDVTTPARAIYTEFTPSDADYSDPQMRNFLLQAFNWLNPVVPIENWEVQVGEFVIDRIAEAHFPHTVKVTGRDYAKRCLLSKFTQATQFAEGQTLETLIKNIALVAGVTKMVLPPTGVVVGRTFFFERGVARWDAMKEIATAYDYEIFFDPSGYLIIRPYNDPSLTAPSFYIQTGREGNVASFEKSTSDTRIYNHILVTGESSDSGVVPVWAEAKNEDPDSPTCIAELGDRLYQYSSSFITTTLQAQTVADSFLKVHALEEFELSFDSLMMPWLDTGEIVGWIDPDPAPGDPTTFLLSSLTIPIALGPMSGSGKRVTNVGGA